MLISRSRFGMRITHYLDFHFLSHYRWKNSSTNFSTWSETYKNNENFTSDNEATLTLLTSDKNTFCSEEYLVIIIKNINEF